MEAGLTSGGMPASQRGIIPTLVAFGRIPAYHFPYHSHIISIRIPKDIGGV